MEQAETGKGNYVTCPQGHKIYVIWSDDKQCFGFTCDNCQEHSLRAVSVHGVIEITIVGRPRQA